ncbi:hypothetical protein KCP78_19760 [Salmonella enterica subsp. enterica]|nr:hypothetical protein KCP78_19760 [Salmonella enterica subsp. enterica]
MELENTARMRKQVLFCHPEAALRKSGEITDGVLEILRDSWFPPFCGQLLPRRSDDIYVSPANRRFNLRTGDTISGKDSPAERRVNAYFALLRKLTKLTTTNRKTPVTKSSLKNLTRCTQTLVCVWACAILPDLTARVLDLKASPIGRGQRGLIVAPPRRVKPCCCRTSRHHV